MTTEPARPAVKEEVIDVVKVSSAIGKGGKFKDQAIWDMEAWVPTIGSNYTTFLHLGKTEHPNEPAIGPHAARLGAGNLKRNKTGQYQTDWYWNLLAWDIDIAPGGNNAPPPPVTNTAPITGWPTPQAAQPAGGAWVDANDRRERLRNDSIQRQTALKEAVNLYSSIVPGRVRPNDPAQVNACIVDVQAIASSFWSWLQMEGDESQRFFSPELLAKLGDTPLNDPLPADDSQPPGDDDEEPR